MDSQQNYKVDIGTEQPKRVPRKNYSNLVINNKPIQPLQGDDYKTEPTIKEAKNNEDKIRDENYGWTLKEKLSSRRQEILRKRAVKQKVFERKHRSVSQSDEFQKFFENKAVFRQEQLKKHYRAIRHATNKYKQINLGSWESDLSNIQKEPEYDWTAPTDAETQKSNNSPSLQANLKANIQKGAVSEYGQSVRPASQQVSKNSALQIAELQSNSKPSQLNQNNSNLNTGAVSNQFLVQDSNPSMGATQKHFNTKSSSFVKYHVKGRNPYDVFQVEQQVSIESIESEIKKALDIKPKAMRNRAVQEVNSATHIDVQSEIQLNKKLRPSTCNNLTFARKISQYSQEAQNFFLTTVDNESQICALQQRRSSNIEQLKKTITQTKLELRELSNAQYRDKRERYVPPTIDEIVQRNTQEGQYTGVKSAFEQRIDNLRMNAELADVDSETKAQLQFDKLHQQAENQKILKQIGYETQQNGGSHLYVRNGIFPRQMFQKIDGFSSFVNNGYYEMIARLKKSVIDVMNLKPEDRLKVDVQELLKPYLQSIQQFQPFDDSFFNQLQYECFMQSNFERNQIIEIKHDYLTIVYQGKAFSGPQSTDTCYPCHTVLDKGIIYNKVCDHSLEISCDCKNDLVLFLINRKRFDDLSKAYWKRQYYLISVFLTHFDFVQTMKNEQIDSISQFTTTKVYKKNELVFQEKDFPLKKFFMVKKGSVSLKRVVKIEQNNFIPSSLVEYQRRKIENPAPHTLGTVGVYQYFGLLESLTDCNASQMPCQFGTANEDDTELVWLSRLDLVKPLTSNQITALLELLQSKTSLVQNIPEEELILRSMCNDKLNCLQKPRTSILPFTETPRRIEKLVDQNRQRAQTAKYNIYELQATAKPRSITFRPLGNKLKKGEIESYMIMQKPDYKSKQNFIQSQKSVVADRTLDHLFDQQHWVQY